MTLPSLRPGRLYITCVEALNVRSRVENYSDENSLSPYILFRMKSVDSLRSERGTNKGHDVDFESTVVSFDLADPKQSLEGNDVLLSVQLQDDTEGIGLIGEAEQSMNKILTSVNTEFLEELKVLRPGDSTTNTVVKLKFLFIPSKIGMLKLYLHHCDFPGAITFHTNGQRKQSTIKNMAKNEPIDFWINKENCFGDLKMYLHHKCNDEKLLELQPLSLIDLGAQNKGKVSTRVPVQSTYVMEVSTIDFHHEFMEAGFVHFESIELRDMPSDAVSDISNVRVIIQSHGKAHRNEQMTDSATLGGSKLLWNNPSISLPVVDDYTLLVKCCEYDDITCDRDEIGMAEISLLPLFRDGSIEKTVNLKHSTELGDELDAGVLRLIATFHPPEGVAVAFPQDQPTMTSYIYVRPEDRGKECTMRPDNVNDSVFTDEDIKKAFSLFDLDKNGYIVSNVDLVSGIEAAWHTLLTRFIHPLPAGCC